MRGRREFRRFLLQNDFELAPDVSIGARSGEYGGRFVHSLVSLFSALDINF